MIALAVVVGSMFEMLVEYSFLSNKSWVQTVNALGSPHEVSYSWMRLAPSLVFFSLGIGVLLAPGQTRKKRS